MIAPAIQVVNNEKNRVVPQLCIFYAVTKTTAIDDRSRASQTNLSSDVDSRISIVQFAPSVTSVS
jgi:hypothetical protein